jgi:hypothetical protein
VAGGVAFSLYLVNIPSKIRQVDFREFTPSAINIIQNRFPQFKVTMTHDEASGRANGRMEFSDTLKAANIEDLTNRLQDHFHIAKSIDLPTLNQALAQAGHPWRAQALNPSFHIKRLAPSDSAQSVFEADPVFRGVTIGEAVKAKVHTIFRKNPGLRQP